MKLDKNLYRFLKDKKSVALVAIALGLGLLMIFLGGRETKSEEQQAGLEERLAEACSGVSGVGECTVMIYYSPADARDGEAVESVIVICDGAESSEVRLRLTEMLSSFFGIGANRIRIEKRG